VVKGPDLEGNNPFVVRLLDVSSRCEKGMCPAASYMFARGVGKSLEVTFVTARAEIQDQIARRRST
jgi:hypothetical protein